MIGHCLCVFQSNQICFVELFFEDGVGVWTKGLVTRGGERELS